METPQKTVSQPDFILPPQQQPCGRAGGPGVLQHKAGWFRRRAGPFQEIFHAGNFFQLFPDEPGEESLSDMIGRLDREFDQRVDMPGHGFFPVERQFDDLLHAFETALGRGDGGDFDPAADVHDIVDKAHGVIALLFGLTVEVGGQFRQTFRSEVSRHRDVLQRRAEFNADLFVDRVVHFFTDKHNGLAWLGLESIRVQLTGICFDALREISGGGFPDRSHSQCTAHRHKIFRPRFPRIYF